MKNFIKKFLMSTLTMALLLLLFSFDVAQASMSRTKWHKQWASFLLTNNGYATPRMCTNSNYYGMNISFCIDYYKNQYLPMLILTKNSTNNNIDTKNYKIRVQARVDSNSIFYSEGTIDDSNGTRFIYLGNAFGERFINEAMKGYNFRIKIDMGQGEDIPVIKFSLLGFTAAYNRVINNLQWQNGGDESYFRTNPPKSDADYFD